MLDSTINQPTKMNFVRESCLRFQFVSFNALVLSCSPSCTVINQYIYFKSKTFCQFCINEFLTLITDSVILTKVCLTLTIKSLNLTMNSLILTINPCPLIQQ